MIERWRLQIRGRVQGIGFRPFVYCLAQAMQISGWVSNSSRGVFIEVQAETSILHTFLDRLQAELPPHAQIDDLACERIPTGPDSSFEIRHSDSQGAKSALILPDMAICPDCLHEIHDPDNRRYRYPFTNCTHCGPRFSIIESLPYDRPATTMRGFSMCPACQAEYANPLDRRFHAQPNACPVCGPQLSLCDGSGHILAERDGALLAAAEILRGGQILALKGLGGFQLLVDARNDDAVARLRTRKNRYEKPFALMIASFEQAANLCEISQDEEGLLCSVAAPIVLLRYRGQGISPKVAPDNPYLGIMLAYTPLHHLLLTELGFPVVATSGNLSGEPICIDEGEALLRLSGIADAFLVHDRPVARHVDDSVVRIAAGSTLMLRRARGYAPLPIDIASAASDSEAGSFIATGAHQKVAFALLHEGRVFPGQHIGDLENAQALTVYQQNLVDFQRIYDLQPRGIVCDLHPDYTTTRYAERTGLPVVAVQHHVAHILACMAEHHLEGPVLGVAWDGTGYGPDGTIWGGEFILVEADQIRRVAHFAPFPLPGGSVTVREPRRSLLGLLYAHYGDDMPYDRLSFEPDELGLLLASLRRGFNCPLTSSAGRLFDAIAALAGLSQRCSFEGQAAMALEFLAMQANTDECYPYQITHVTNEQGLDKRIIEVRPLIGLAMQEVQPALLSAKFHNTLADIIVSIAQQLGVPQVALSGGCFQNRVLLERSVDRLNEAGFTACWPQQMPANDGGIALGQIEFVLREGQDVFSRTRTVSQHDRRGP